jgi:endonuclease YncB( thermonuclease family)
MSDPKKPPPQAESGMSPRRSVPAAPGVRVFDGDTFTYQGEKIRIANIDTPELFSPHCDSEKRLAHMARARLVQLLADPAGVTLERQDKLDMFGRTLARVSVAGKDIGQTLINENLASPWEGKRHSWCCW